MSYFTDEHNPELRAEYRQSLDVRPYPEWLEGEVMRLRAELQRLQARERRYRELERHVRKDGGGWFADTLRAIREET